MRDGLLDPMPDHYSHPIAALDHRIAVLRRRLLGAVSVLVNQQLGSPPNVDLFHSYSHPGRFRPPV
jgi:hypothetical protein